MVPLEKEEEPMAMNGPVWPCLMCNPPGERPADMLADILELAVAGAGPDLPAVADLVAKCLKHGDITGKCPSIPEHCAEVEKARNHAAGGDWVLCIDALDHP
jgi:hypothetical protein